jgi:hypothetical protein
MPGNPLFRLYLSDSAFRNPNVKNRCRGDEPIPAVAVAKPLIDEDSQGISESVPKLRYTNNLAGTNYRAGHAEVANAAQKFGQEDDTSASSL